MNATIYPVVGIISLTVLAGGFQTRTNPSYADGIAISQTPSLAGNVVSDAGQPVPNASVSLVDIVDQHETDTTATNAEGAFVLHGVRSGRYDLVSAKTAFLPAHYGSSNPQQPGIPIVVANGTTLSGLVLRMWKGGIVTGSVADRFGKPVANASVVAILDQPKDATFVKRLNETVVVTDDTGHFRLYGLRPGQYAFCAVPPRGSASSGLTWLQFETNRSKPPVMEGYTPTYYPGVVDVAQAQSLTVKAAEELQEIHIPLQVAQLTDISGVLVGDSKQGALVSLVARQAWSARIGVRTTVVGPDHRFRMNGIPQGGYTLVALGGTDSAGEFTQWGSQDVDVDGSTTDPIQIVLHPTLRVQGRTHFEPDASRPDLHQLPRLDLVPTAPGQLRSNFSVDLAETFTIGGIIPGSYFLSVQPSQEASPWVLASAEYDGESVIDSPMEVNSERASELILGMSLRTRVEGHLRSASSPPTDYMIIMFPRERRLWTRHSGRLQIVRPATDGSYLISGLPAGDYQLAAMQVSYEVPWFDDRLLTDLSEHSFHIDLIGGALTKQDVVVR